MSPSRPRRTRPTALFRANPLRQSTRLPHDGRPVPAEARRALEAAGRAAAARAILTEDAAVREGIVDPVREGDRALLGLGEETTVLLVRVGFGPEAPFSLRRPVEEVIVSP